MLKMEFNLKIVPKIIFSFHKTRWAKKKKNEIAKFQGEKRKPKWMGWMDEKCVRATQNYLFVCSSIVVYWLSEWIFFSNSCDDR